MDDANGLWTYWQALLDPYKEEFTEPGWVRFTQWVTGMVLCWEEHTITQILTSLGLESRWRVLEHFAEYGAFDRRAVENRTIRLIEERVAVNWCGYRVVALDDTKEHRTSKDVWGICTFHEPASRSPNRAETVRAHNWVVAGDLVPGTPWTYLPHSARLYFRKSQLPAGEKFCTKTQHAAEMLRQEDEASTVQLLAVFDGAFAKKTVIGPCLQPKEGQRRIDIVTRLRVDARLYASKVPNAMGRKRVWGSRLPAPQHHEQWEGAWKKGKGYIYSRQRRYQYKHLRCYWNVTGPTQAVDVYVFQVEGYREPWYLVTTALSLSAKQVVEAYTARYRQENGFREHKQRLGMEECRAWTKEPILRTFAVQMVSQTLLRLLQFQLDKHCGEGSWWKVPEWNTHKKHPSLLDARRLLWSCREEFSHFLVELEELRKVGQEPKLKNAG